MRKNQLLTRTQAHELLMQNKKHYLWNVPYNKWTEEDEQNLINGIDKDRIEPKYAPVQPVKVIYKDGTEKIYMSAAACSRKLGINVNTIYAAINGRRRLKKVKYPLFEKLNH